jgi:UTP:GlnB (protein PII) uridylyltransferase
MLGGDLGPAFWIMYNDPTKTLSDIEEIAQKPEVKKLTEEMRRAFQIILAGMTPRDIEYQEKVARNLGYRNTRESLAVELLMRDYYMCATEIKQFASEFVEGFTSPPLAGGRKKRIVDGFEITVRGLTLPERKSLKGQC